VWRHFKTKDTVVHRSYKRLTAVSFYFFKFFWNITEIFFSSADKEIETPLADEIILSLAACSQQYFILVLQM
jgi:hypothetical protein